MEEPVVGSLSAAVLCGQGEARQQRMQAQARAELHRNGILQTDRFRVFGIQSVP